MKRLVLGLLVILFSIQTIGCDSGGGGGAGTTGSPTPDAPAADSPAQGGGNASKAASKVATGLANPHGPKNDR